VQAEQEALVVGELPIEGKGEPVALAPQPPLGEVGHGRGRGGALGQGAQHRHAGNPEHAVHHAPELDAGALEQLERAVALRGHGADQRLAVAHQLAQHPDLRRRHEAGAHQPVPDQVGDPLRVLHVGLAPGQVAHVRGVADDEREGAFQGSVDGLPVDACSLHADVGDPFLQQPRAQGREVLAHGAEAAHLLGRPASCRAEDDAGHHRALMHIEPGGAFDECFHRHLPRWRARRRGTENRGWPTC
jgi:hypothetical protein